MKIKLIILFTIVSLSSFGQAANWWTVQVQKTQHTQEYATNGTYTWTAPPGVTSVTVEMIGAGGSGGVIKIGTHGSAGGGGGAYAKFTFSITGGSSHTVVVGKGGVCKLADGGEDGGDSKFEYASSSYKIAAGGKAGESIIGTPYEADGGAGGTINTTADVAFAGGQGGDGDYGNEDAGCGAAAASSNGSGADGADFCRNTVGNGVDGLFAGYGGSGAFTNSTTDYVGGSGKDGKIILTWWE